MIRVLIHVCNNVERVGMQVKEASILESSFGVLF